MLYLSVVNKMDIITSVSNKIIKFTASLKEKKYREESGCFIIEGEKFSKEMPDDWNVRYFLLSESFAQKHGSDWYKNRAETYVADNKSFNKAADADAPQGVLAVCEKKECSIELFLQNNSKNGLFLVALSEVSDPGNVGTIIRTADASGANGVILSKNCADVYNPKTLRSTAGSIFHLPIIHCDNFTKMIKTLNNSGIMTVAADVRSKKYPYSIDFTKKCCIIIGNEAKGLSAETVELCSETVKVPMFGSAESLNANVAASVLIYEAVRQRIIV